MSSPEPVVYVFYGQDTPTLKEKLADFYTIALSDLSIADLNITRLDGSSVQLNDIGSTAGALPFLADTRLVVVENLTDSANGRAIIEQLPSLFTDLPSWARVLFIEKDLEGPLSKGATGESSRMTARRPALKKLINIVEADPRGKVLAFDMPKNPARWIQNRAVYHQATIEPRAASLLAQRVGKSLELADMELMKLATYTNGERPISIEDVQLLTPYTPEAGIFKMVDALGQRRGDTALALLRKLLDENNAPLMIFGMIIRQFRLLIQMKEQLEQGHKPASAGKIIRVHRFVADKLAEQSRSYSLETLERIYRHLLKIDLEIKTGNTQPELALETLITRLAGRD